MLSIPHSSAFVNYFSRQFDKNNKPSGLAVAALANIAFFILLQKRRENGVRGELVIALVNTADSALKVR
jgi:hypothetical protein